MLPANVNPVLPQQVLFKLRRFMLYAFHPTLLAVPSKLCLATNLFLKTRGLFFITIIYRCGLNSLFSQMTMPLLDTNSSRDSN